MFPRHPRRFRTFYDEFLPPPVHVPYSQTKLGRFLAGFDCAVTALLGRTPFDTEGRFTVLVTPAVYRHEFSMSASMPEPSACTCIAAAVSRLSRADRVNTITARGRFPTVGTTAVVVCGVSPGAKRGNDGKQQVGEDGRVRYREEATTGLPESFRNGAPR